MGLAMRAPSIRQTMALLCSGGIFVACSPQKFGVQNSAESFGAVATYNTDIDVLWVIEDAGSMTARQPLLAAQVTPFLNALNKTGLNYQMAVTTMDMGGSGEDGNFVAATGTPKILTSTTPNLNSILQNRLVLGGNGSPVVRGLQAMNAALTPPLSTSGNAGFLRDNSLLVVIFLADENDQSPSMDYQSWLNQIRPPAPSGAPSWIANFIGVVPSDPNCLTANWDYFNPGTAFISLATASSGAVGSICEPDYSAAVSGLQERILEIVTRYPLSGSPEVSSIQVFENGVSVATDPNNGWTYDSTSNAVVFHGTAIPTPTTKISVTFTPANLD